MRMLYKTSLLTKPYVFLKPISHLYTVPVKSHVFSNIYWIQNIWLINLSVTVYLKLYWWSPISSFMKGVNLPKIVLLFNLWPTQGRVEGWDAMKPLYYRSVSSKEKCRPTTPGAPSQGLMKWNEKWMIWGWRNCRIKFVVWENGRHPAQTPFRPPRNPHGVTETRTRDPSGGRRAPNRLRHEAAQ